MFNYIRSLFCRHDFVFVKEVEKYQKETDKYPIGFCQFYFCNKCGRTLKIKM